MNRFSQWNKRSEERPKTPQELQKLLLELRSFEPAGKLEFGDHGLQQVVKVMYQALKENKKIALYADYDVDGTMSCVSWVWFFKALGFENFLHYIPCRFSEGYGVNLEAVKKLIHTFQADVIITMDTGITANEEAAYAMANGVTFICTDHHVVQKDKLPDALILNPKLHPDRDYQELCGCGITFVLLRKLAALFPGLLEQGQLWSDLLALAGIATICDVVELNPVNHKIAKSGVRAFMNSKRPIFEALKKSASLGKGGDEKDIGFRIGPRINAVGRMDHADKVVEAFIEEDPSSLIPLIEKCNDMRRKIQDFVVLDAREKLKNQNGLIRFVGGEWHPGVLGIAAAKITENFWSPTWLFQIKDGICKGSARSIKGFHVTEAMTSVKELFKKFGGHGAAGGFLFAEEDTSEIFLRLEAFAQSHQQENPNLWQSQVEYDCELASATLDLDWADCLADLKPFGNGFEEPRFLLRGSMGRVEYYKDKETGLPKHSAIYLGRQKILFFNQIIPKSDLQVEVLTSLNSQTFRGERSLSLMGMDLRCS